MLLPMKRAIKRWLMLAVALISSSKMVSKLVNTPLVICMAVYDRARFWHCRHASWTLNRVCAAAVQMTAANTSAWLYHAYNKAILLHRAV